MDNRKDCFIINSKVCIKLIPIYFTFCLEYIGDHLCKSNKLFLKSSELYVLSFLFKSELILFDYKIGETTFKQPDTLVHLGVIVIHNSYLCLISLDSGTFKINDALRERIEIFRLDTVKILYYG